MEHLISKGSLDHIFLTGAILKEIEEKEDREHYSSHVWLVGCKREVLTSERLNWSGKQLTESWLGVIAKVSSRGAEERRITCLCSFNKILERDSAQQLHVPSIIFGIDFVRTCSKTAL